MKKILFILVVVLPALLFAQQSDTNQLVQNNTFTIEKPGTLHRSNFDITIGGRIVRDKDTISLSLVMKARGIGIRDTLDEDYFLYSFESQVPMFSGDPVCTNFYCNFLPAEDSVIAHAENGSLLYIGKVIYVSNQKTYFINKPMYLRLVKPKTPKPPHKIDTTAIWEMKFEISIANHTEGSISKKELLKAAQVDISGPVDSIVIRSFDVTFQSVKTFNSNYSGSIINSNFAQSGNGMLTTGMLGLIKDAPINTTIIISNITYTSGKNGDPHELKKTLSLTIK